jgi:hypothetical protein
MHKREEIFHSINDARGRGVQWAEIAKNVKRNPQSFMREARKTWDWGNLDGRDWARRTVCHFMTHDDADYEDLTDALGTDDEFALLNPDPIYQEGWFHGVFNRPAGHRMPAARDGLAHIHSWHRPWPRPRVLRVGSHFFANDSHATDRDPQFIAAVGALEVYQVGTPNVRYLWRSQPVDATLYLKRKRWSVW